MKRNLESRMRAVETANRGTGDKFFMVWGRDAKAIEATISDAKRAGTILPGEVAVHGIWPEDARGEPPAPQWISVKEVSDAELELLTCQAKALPHTPTQSRDDAAHKYTDAELFGIAFGRRGPG